MADSTNGTQGNGTFLSKEEICDLPIEFENYFHAAFLILILIVTFIGNLLVILAVIFFRRLRTITNYFVASLAVSDLLISLLSLPFKIDQTVNNFQWCLDLTSCKALIVIDALCSFASIWNLAIISIDRYVAIVHPFRYHSVITAKVGYGMISFVWGFSTIMAMTALLHWENPGQEHISIATECKLGGKNFFIVSGVVSFFLPLFIILVMYSLVFRVALNQARALAALQVDSRRRGGRRSSINLVREVKAAKTLAVVIGCFIVCWLPFNVFIQIGMSNKELLAKIPDEHFLGINIAFAYVLPSINSTLNPIIYALFNRDFRSAFYKLTRRLTGRRLGAVGFDEGTGSNIESTVSLHEKKKNNGPSKSITFRPSRESESSENPPPTVAMQDPNVYHDGTSNEQPQITENNCVTPSALSIKTNLDIVNNLKGDMKSPNGCVGSDEDGKSLNNGDKLPPLKRKLSLEKRSDVQSDALPPIKANSVDEEHKLDTQIKDKEDTTLEDS